MRYNKKKTPSGRINMNGPQSFSVMSFVVYHFLLHVRSQLKTNQHTYQNIHTLLPVSYISICRILSLSSFVFVCVTGSFFLTYANLTWTDTEKV